MSKLLINENPMVISPTLVIELGSYEAAAFLQQLHFWLGISQIQKDGKPWVWNTIDTCVEMMRNTIKKRSLERIIADLKSRNLIITTQLSDNKWDKTNYFTINYEELSKIDAKYHSIPCVSDTAKVAESKPPKCRNQPRQSGGIETAKVAECLQKNTTEEYIQNTTDDQFDKFWETVPNKDGKKAAVKSFKTAIKKTNLETLITAYKAYIKICDKQSRFKKNPSTWLDGECWNDESIQFESKNSNSNEIQDTPASGFTFQLPTKPKGFLGDNQ